MDFPYPDNTPGSDFKNNSGRYLRNLTEANQVILQEMKDWVKQDNINLADLSPCILDESLLLLRYLRANNFKTPKAKKQMLKCMEWRKAQRVDEISKLTPEQILGCKVADLVEHFPHWHFGYDKTGRPLLFKQQGAFDMKAIKALCGGNFEKVFQYHIWEQELISRVCYEQSLKTRTIIETITVVLDVKGMTFSSLTSDFRAMMSALIKMDQDMYPETLGRILIVNAPSAFPMIWGVMKPWFDAITAAKVKILGTDYQAKLNEHVGTENLPANYGGSRPALTTAVHPYAEAMSLAGLHGDGSVNGLAGAVATLKMSGNTVPVVPATVFTAATSTASECTSSGTPASSPAASAPEAEGEPEAEPAPAEKTGGYKQREFIY